MKHLHLSWSEIKRTPRFELEGLLIAYTEHEELHSMDGYSERDIKDMAKNRPEIRHQWIRYLEKKRKYYAELEKKNKMSFSDIM